MSTAVDTARTRPIPAEILARRKPGAGGTKSIGVDFAALNAMFGAGQSLPAGKNDRAAPPSALTAMLEATDPARTNKSSRDDVAGLFAPKADALRSLVQLQMEASATNGGTSSAGAESLFDRIDTDKDDAVSRAELEAFLASETKKPLTAALADEAETASDATLGFATALGQLEKAFLAGRRDPAGLLGALAPIDAADRYTSMRDALTRPSTKSTGATA